MPGFGATSLGIGQDLTNEVHGTLHFEGVSLFFLLYHQGGTDHLHGGHNVEQKWFLVGRGTRIGAFFKSCLTLSSASWALGVHSKWLAFFRSR